MDDWHFRDFGLSKLFPNENNPANRGIYKDVSQNNFWENPQNI